MLETVEFLNLNSRRYIYLPLSFTGLQKTRVYNTDYYLFIFCGATLNAGHGLLIFEVSRSHTKRRTTVGRTPLDE